MTRFSSLNLEHGFRMIYTRRLCTLMFLGLAIAFSPVDGKSAVAEEVIAVLDLGKILARSNAMKKAEEKIAALEQQYRESQKAREQAFRDEEQKLLQQRAILSPEAFSTKRDEFRSRARDFQTEVRAKIRQFSLTRANVVRDIETALEPIVSKIAKSVKADMILERKQVLFSAKTLDISDSIVTAFNKAVPSIPVKLVPLQKK